MTLYRNNSAGDGAGARRTVTDNAYYTLPTISSLGWTRSGYTFKGWATYRGAAAASYSDGERIYVNSSLTTLYAVWQSNASKHVMTLYRNNSAGDGAGARRTVTDNAYYTLPTISSLGWTRSGYVFLGWSQQRNASSATYGDGARIYVASGLYTLYAVWERANAVAFTISNGVLTGVELNGKTSVVIPNSVTCIGEWAFDGCEAMTGVTIPASVTNIRYGAFMDCSGLTSVTIPDSVASIDTDAFCGCSSLTSVRLGSGVQALGRIFPRCGLKSVQIPNGVTSLEYTFMDCDALESVTMPDSLTNVGDAVFNGCTAMRSVTIPDGVTSIGNTAFFGCGALTHVTIGRKVTSIGAYAFRFCGKLTSISFRGNAPTVGTDAFTELGSGCVVRVSRSSTGWGVPIPGTWNGLRIEYAD